MGCLLLYKCCLLFRVIYTIYVSHVNIGSNAVFFFITMFKEYATFLDKKKFFWIKSSLGGMDDQLGNRKNNKTIVYKTSGTPSPPLLSLHVLILRFRI